MVNTYTLEEAARVLGISTDEARKQLKTNNIREFQDPSRKTIRYPVPAVDELARQLGHGSDPQLQLGESRRPKGADSPPPRKKVPEDQVDIGAHTPTDKPSSKKRVSGLKSPAPKKGSDSDVRLVAEGSDLDFKVASDSDVKMIDESAPSSQSGTAAPDSGLRVIPPERKSDSDVKIVPAAGDSGAVPLHAAPAKSPSDSDIRLQSTAKRDDSSDSSVLTDEIDLDAELRKAAEKKAKKTQAPPAAGKQLPAGSPFELSDSNVNLEAAKEKDSSDDFVLTPGSPSSSSEIELSSSELRKLTPEEEVSFGAGQAKAGDSGINLHDPADSGVSLEKKGDSSDEGEFELSLDSGSSPAIHKDKKAKKAEESSSEFELSLEGQAKKEPDSDSEFELSLDVEGSPTDSGSDSEFELTLDDSGGLAPIDEEQKKDIFETDFEVPALDEESGQRAPQADADTDLESSEFDIALDEGDAEREDAESGSQVVALDDEAEADEGAETVARPRRGGAAIAEDEAEVDELLGGEAEPEGSDEMVGAGAAVAAEPEPWGPVPAIGLGLTVVVMILVTFISYEQLQSMWGYRTGSGVANSITRAIGGLFSDLPKE
jgi:hypothetical protein